MTPDEIFHAWIADIENIRQDVHEMFSLRRTFRDVAEVFRENPRLQEVGGHLWEWILLNYSASVLIRVRRLVQGQKGTVDLDQLLRGIIDRPDVVTRGRRYAIHGPIEPAELREFLDKGFTKAFVRNPDPNDPDADQIDPAIVEADLRELDKAAQAVTAVANRAIAHRTRVKIGDPTYGELDQAFDAIEATLKKYYALIVGNSLTTAEATPQFDTHKVFTFPWIESREGQE